MGRCIDASPHSHHLTRAARLALRAPGTALWGLVLRLGLATRPCPEASA